MRWLVVLGALLAGIWILRASFEVLISPRPALKAQFLVFGNLYELTAAALVTAAYIVLRKLNSTAERRLSFLALFASLAVLLNPAILHVFFRATGLPWVGRGDSEMRSFLAGVVALTAGIVAAVRIRRSRGSLTGSAFAVTGIIGGGLWVVLWTFTLLALIGGVSGWL